MKILYVLLFILLTSISLEAYSKKIVLGTFSNKSSADIMLNQADSVLKSKEFYNLSKENNFKAYVRISDKYYILVIEPINSEVILEKTFNLVKPNFQGAFVSEYTELEKNKSIASKDANIETTQIAVNKKESTGDNNKALQSIDKEVNTEKYNLAKKLFESQKYEKAYIMFNNLFLNDLSNPNINFYLGQSAYKLKKYEEALSAYERILMIDEKAYRAKLEMARCYQKLGLLKEAKEALLSVRDKVPQDVQKNVDLYLAAIEDKRKKHSLSGAVILGMNYDSNIYGVTVDNVISNKIPNYTLNNTALNGWAHQEVIAANYAYAKSETIKYKADLVLFNKNIFSYHDMDLFLVQMTPAVSVTYSKDLTVDYAVFANKIWLNLKPLMTNWGLYPKIKYIYSPTVMLNGAFKFQSQQNAAPSENRDNYTYSLELGAQHIYSKELTFGAKTKFDIVREKTSAEIADLNEVAYNLYELTLNANYKYTPKIMVAPKFKIYQKNYIEQSISPLTGLELYKRSDKEYQIWLSGTYIYNPNMLLTLEYIHAIHDSNYADNRFNKDTLSANVIIPF